MSQLEYIGNGLYLAPHTANLWRAAGAPELTGKDAAWRPYAVQKQYYLDFLAGRGPVASNPDDPRAPRNHQRGAAFDMKYPSAVNQARCRAVGLIRDPVETWHENDPLASSMPIIVSLATAGLGVTPLYMEDTMRFALDPTRTTYSGTKIIKAVYIVVGNGKPRDFTGTQTQANHMAAIWGPTFQPTKDEWPTFLAAVTPQI